MAGRGTRRHAEFVRHRCDRRSSRDVVVAEVDGDGDGLALFRRQRSGDCPVATVVLTDPIDIDGDSVGNIVERRSEVVGVADDGERRLATTRVDDRWNDHETPPCEGSPEVEVGLTSPLVDVDVEGVVVDGREVVVGDRVDTGERGFVGRSVTDDVEQQTLQVFAGAEVPAEQISTRQFVVVGDDVLHRMPCLLRLPEREMEVLHSRFLTRSVQKEADSSDPKPIERRRVSRRMSSQETVDDRPLPPGPDGVPLVGNTLEFVRDVFGFYDTLAEYGDVVGYHVGGYEFVTLLHPDQVEQVLVSDADTYEKGDILRQSGVEFLEHGVLLTEGEEWRRQRTAMQPTFYRERVETYGETMADYAARLVDSWDDGDVVDLTDEFSALALSILAKTLFGVDIRNEESAIRDAAHAVQERSDAGSIQSFLPDWLPTPRNRRFRRATDEFDQVVRTLVAERRRAEEPSDDLLSLLLDVTYEDGTAMDEETVRDQLMTFLFAGHETTSLALSYAVFALAQRPEVAERLRAEVDDVVGEGRPTAAEVRRLDYTGTVLKETLRLYPPAYVLFRQPTRDVTLGGYRVPEETNLTLPAFRLHTDPRWYDDPESFRPERWTDEMEAELPDYAYFPFGGGPRHCLGMRFAMLELHLVLATLAQSCEFELVSDADVEFTPAATLQPKEEIRVRVRKR